MSMQPERPWEKTDEADVDKPASRSITGCGGCLMIVGLAVVAFIVWYAIALGKGDSGSSGQGSGGAEVACERAVKSQIIEAKIDHQQAVQMSDTRWIISGYVTGTNQLGWNARVHFHCDGITNDDGDTWQSSKAVIGD